MSKFDQGFYEYLELMEGYPKDVDPFVVDLRNCLREMHKLGLNPTVRDGIEFMKFEETSPIINFSDQHDEGAKLVRGFVDAMKNIEDTLFEISKNMRN